MRRDKTLPRRCTLPPLPPRSSLSQDKVHMLRARTAMRHIHGSIRGTRSYPPAAWLCLQDTARSSWTKPDPQMFHMIRERRAYSHRARLLPGWRRTALSGSRGIVRGCRCPVMGCICLSRTWRSPDVPNPIAQQDMKPACTRPFRPRPGTSPSRKRHSLCPR